MAGRRVRVLADHQDPHVGQRPRERAQHGVGGGEPAPAGRALGAQRVADPAQRRLHRGEGGGPVGGHDPVERLAGHTGRVVGAAE